MSSWFNKITNIFKLDSNPSKVVEVKQEKYSDRIVQCREDGIVLYGPGGKDQEMYEILLLRPYHENLSNAFR